MDNPRSRSRSISTWRYLGRVAFHADPEHRCLPPSGDPDAVQAWSEGYRLGWCFWYNRLPSSPIDQRCLKAELERALHQGDGQSDAMDHADDHRALGRLH